MNDKTKTPIPGLNTKLICAHCQQAALDKAKASSHAVESVDMTYCEHTQRGLTVFAKHGQPTNYLVSDRGAREQVEAVYHKFRNAAAATLQRRLDDGRLTLGDDGELHEHESAPTGNGTLH